ncbi:ATP-grasp domain-containing protein [Dactylosporangium sp. CA-092794]|uniref:ATP-grasp domain-containing protein n=1 Tax=Dactylosporangium sp. CA-092794 TaxID=3239929 RepID=UPI003D8F22AE
MSVLVLHRNPFEPFPYDRWLADYPGEIVVLAAADKLRSFGEPVPTGNLGFDRLEFLERFDDDEEVRKHALELAVEFTVDRVVAHHEADVDTAAWLRERLNLPGAWPADLLPFRDKALMKRLAQRAGVEVAPHTVAGTAAEALAFAEAHGFPVVLKERAGYSAIGLRILHDRAALADSLAEAYSAGPRTDLLIEAFVPGRMCHVDGLVIDGRIVLAWPSQYQYDLASFGSDPGARVDLTLDPDDPLTDRLLAMTARLVTGLKRAEGRQYPHAFHAEIFHTPDDRLVLCEIASRPGGAKIREVFHAMFGINLGEYATRAQLGLPLPALAETLRGGPPPRPRVMSGQVLMMKRPGVVRAVPEAPAESWVERFWVYAQRGQTIPAASGSADFLAAAIATAATRTECEHRLRTLGARLVSQTDIVAEP